MRRLMLALVVALLLMSQDQCPDGQEQVPAEYVPQHEGRSTSPNKDGATRVECGKNRFTFRVEQTGVTCGATFNFNPLLNQAKARRDAVFATMSCPQACAGKLVVDNALKARCRANNTAAEVILESSVVCPKPNDPPVPGITIPVPIPVGPYDQGVETPWNPIETFDEPFNSTPVACNELIRYTYTEAVDACGGPYKRQERHAKEEVKRYHATLTCAAGCKKLADPRIANVQTSCANNQVTVVIHFRSCVP